MSRAAIIGVLALAGAAVFFAAGHFTSQHGKIATLTAGHFGPAKATRGEPGEPTAGSGSEKNEIRARDKWFYGQRAFPHRFTPPGALARATRETRALQRSSTERESANPWTRIGPNPIASIGPDANAASGQFGGSLPLAGRVSAIAPANANVIYLGGANGGVWKSINGGASWASVWPNTMASFSIGSIAVNPSNANDVWVGTGEANGAGDSYYGEGIYHSLNGGTTWTKVGGTTFNGCFISDIAVVSATTVNVGVLEFTGIPNPACSSATRGVWRTTNTGASWKHIILTGPGNCGGSPCQAVSDFTQAPGVPNTIYLATYQDGIWRSLNGGGTWTKIVNTTGYYREAISAYNASTLYFVGSAGSSGADFGPMYKITGANTSTLVFTVLNPGGPTNTPCTYPGAGGGQCWYDLTVAADPTNSKYVFVGGIRVYRFTTAGSNAGTNIGYGAGAGNIHVDQHATVFDPSGNMWEGSDGGAYRLPASLVVTGNHSFTNRNGSGSTALGISEFNGWTSGSVVGGTFIGGLQDNGTVKYTSGGAADCGALSSLLNWCMDHGGDGGASAFVNSKTYFASYYGNDVFRTLNGGTSYTDISPAWSSDPGNFYTPMAQDAANTATLYRGTDRIWRTTNATTTHTWTAISPHFTGFKVSAIGVEKLAAPQYVYAGIDGATSQIRYTHNATAATPTWSIGSGTPNLYVSDIWVNPANHLNAIAVFSGFGPSHVYRTTTGGAKWLTMNGNLPNVPVDSVTVDPANVNHVFLGTDTGVFYSANGTAATPTWSTLNGTTLPATAVTDITVDGSYLIAATHGRSAWKALKP